MLRDLMIVASERTNFERARELRDTLRWLEQLESPSVVEVAGSGDADVIGYARDGDDAVGLFFRVRDGRVVSREHRFLENSEEVPDPQVLSAFLVGYYLPGWKGGGPIATVAASVLLAASMIETVPAATWLVT